MGTIGICRKLRAIGGCLLLWCLWLQPAWAVQALKYDVSFPDAAAHYVDVTLHVEASSEATAEYVDLMLPVWTPGSYLVREYARFVEGGDAVDEQGNTLGLQKISKNRWRVQVPNDQGFKVSYRVYCHELSVRTNWVDDELAVLNGAATFLVPVDGLDRSGEVGFELPPTWPRSVCPLSMANDRPHVYHFENYDQLVDSPILCGDCQVFPFQVAGKNHYLVNLGDDELWDGQKAAVDLQKVVAAHHEFWGEVPYEHYYFLNVILGSGGGLEHDDSTLVMANRRTMVSPQSYRRWLSLCSHELFHAWNVRRLRPQALVNYDYEAEQYTRELWVAEGITSYYQDLLLVRAGLIDEKAFLQSLSGNIRGIEGRIGNSVQSVTESSFETWIDFYRPHENSSNTSVSYYSRGAVIGFLLDGELRRRSNHQTSLDQVMVQLYSRFRDSGYLTEDLLALCNELSPAEPFDDWFESYVLNPGALDYEPTMMALGLRWSDSTAGESNSERKQLSRLGISVSQSDGRLTVSGIRAGEAGQLAGLQLEDEILAVGERRVTSGGGLADELELISDGALADLLIARRQKLRRLPVECRPPDETSWRLARSSGRAPEQDKAFEQWLSGQLTPPAEPEETEETEENSAGEGAADVESAEEAQTLDPPSDTDAKTSMAAETRTESSDSDD